MQRNTFNYKYLHSFGYRIVCYSRPILSENRAPRVAFSVVLEIHARKINGTFLVISDYREPLGVPDSDRETSCWMGADPRSNPNTVSWKRIAPSRARIGAACLARKIAPLCPSVHRHCEPESNDYGCAGGSRYLPQTRTYRE